MCDLINSKDSIECSARLVLAPVLVLVLVLVPGVGSTQYWFRAAAAPSTSLNGGADWRQRAQVSGMLPTSMASVISGRAQVATLGQWDRSRGCGPISRLSPVSVSIEQASLPLGVLTKQKMQRMLRSCPPRCTGQNNDG